MPAFDWRYGTVKSAVKHALGKPYECEVIPYERADNLRVRVFDLGRLIAEAYVAREEVTAIGWRDLWRLIRHNKDPWCKPWVNGLIGRLDEDRKRRSACRHSS